MLVAARGLEVWTKLDFHELDTVFRRGDLTLREGDVMVGAAGLGCNFFFLNLNLNFIEL